MQQPQNTTYKVIYPASNNFMNSQPTTKRLPQWAISQYQELKIYERFN